MTVEATFPALVLPAFAEVDIRHLPSSSPYLFSSLFFCWHPDRRRSDRRPNTQGSARQPQRPIAYTSIWLDFLQSVANEQAGRRPALVLSPLTFNQLTGRCIACPITRRDRDWSFHVAIPDNDEISGVVQTDQLRSASWEQRGSRFISKAPASVLDEVRARLKPLLSL